MTRVPQVNFSKGEIAPQLYARFDVEAWSAALKRARNVLIQKYGGRVKRTGTRIVGEVLDPSAPVRLIPFEFSLDQTYALEFGQAYVAPIALGGRVLEEELEITAISAATNAIITAAFHGYSAGNRVFLNGITGTMGPFLNNQSWRVTNVVDANNFAIDADTTGMTFISATGGITRVGAPPPPPEPPPVPPPPPPPAPPPISPPEGGWDGLNPVLIP